MSEKHSVRKEWDAATESWVDFVRRGKDYYREYLNNPATLELIGDVSRLIVLDLACGDGYNTRILAKKGAKVTGVDFSEKMIELAKREEAEEKLGIDYHVADAADLRILPSNHFDLVTCFMSLQDIENYRRAISEVARVLRHRSQFVFSILHPCFCPIIVNGKRVTTTKRYFGVVTYPIQWKMERLIKPFKTTSFHRTLTDYFDALSKSRLCVSKLVEPRPTPEGLQKHPQLREVLVIPQSIIIQATKIADK
ncbi:MAG: class I SAM-dependent methyltransferase [Candidatus Bathyarchaeota archaeon]|nr:class I SAM-dependent methyltransferase [Candidatus Bathyarchaeota archaeon]